MMWKGPFGFADGWGWFRPFHFIIPLLFFWAIIAVVVLLVRYLALGPAFGSIRTTATRP